MKELPAYILRNCALWFDRDSKLGQASTITVPKPKVKTEELRNAGMIKPRRVHLGFELLDFSFKMTALDPATIRRFGLSPGVETEILATAALVDEDTTAPHSAALYMRGTIIGLDGDDWATGTLVNHEFQMDVPYYKLEIDGQPIYEITDFDMLVNGQSQFAAQRAAMLL